MGFYDNLRRMQAIEQPELLQFNEAMCAFEEKFGFVPTIDIEGTTDPVAMTEKLIKAIESNDCSEFAKAD